MWVEKHRTLSIENMMLFKEFIYSNMNKMWGWMTRGRESDGFSKNFKFGNGSGQVLLAF